MQRLNDKLGALLKLLRDSEGVYRSGEELGRALGISRVAVWKHIQTLRRSGCIVEAKPKLGYRLVKDIDLLTPALIRDGLQTSFIGYELLCFDTVPSTQDVAKEAASRGVKEGLVVVAEQQTDGKGRMGRRWFSPRGGLWLSVILKPRLAPSKIPVLTLAAGVAISRAIEEACGLNTRLKWPNDVLINNRKVAGILAEAAIEADVVHYVVLGIGVNVNNELKPELRREATSLKEVLRNEVPRVKLTQEVLEALEDEYLMLKRGGQREVLNDWRARSNTLKSEVTVSFMDEVYEGVAEDIDEDGGLIVKLKDGSLKRFLAGDVTLRARALK